MNPETPQTPLNRAIQALVDRNKTLRETVETVNRERAKAAEDETATLTNPPPTPPSVPGTEAV